MPTTLKFQNRKTENQTKMTAHQYDESKIKTLSSLEHIRKRPGMYIGRLGNGSHQDDGIYILIKEIIDNAVDEYIMGYGKRVEIFLDDRRCRVRDYGRGIPLGKIIDCVSVINTGAKYNTDVFQFSVGLNGVGTKAVNAMSSLFTVTTFRDGNYGKAIFARGKVIGEEQGTTEDQDGTLIEFLPDSELFPEYNYDPKFIEQRLWRYAYLNAGLSLYFNDNRYYSEKGLLDLLGREVNAEAATYPPLYFTAKNLEFAFTHTDDYSEIYFSFVNGTYTSEGGTHLSAFREGILKGVNEFSGKKYNGKDVRDGIVGVLALKV